MTIKNIRQFNSILSAVGSVEQHYTDLLSFAVSNMSRHGNKDPMLSFLNAPFLRTKTGKIKKAYTPLIQWLNVACFPLDIGILDMDKGKVTKFTASTLPAKVLAHHIRFDPRLDPAIQSYTDWLTDQASDKEPSSPATKVTAKALAKYLESKLELSLTASDQGEIDALVKAAKALIIAAGKATLPAVDDTRVEELAKTKASKAEKSAGQKVG